MWPRYQVPNITVFCFTSEFSSRDIPLEIHSNFVSYVRSELAFVYFQNEISLTVIRKMRKGSHVCTSKHKRA